MFFRLLAVIAVCAAFLAPAEAGDWKGSTVDESGVTHVMNPAVGMESAVTLQLEELWRLGGDTDAEDEFFGVINRVLTGPDGNVYLLDAQLSEVKVYSPDGEYLRTIGREGEGPGEFRAPQDMFFLPDGNLGVLQLAPGRIVMLTPDGEPAGDHPLVKDEAGASPILVGGQVMGKNLVLVINENKFEEGKLDITRSLMMIDSEGKEIQRLVSETRAIVFANAVFDEKIWSTFDRRWQVAPTGQLIAATKFQDYEINVWNTAGKLERIVSREYEPLDRTQEEKDRIKGIFEAFTRQIPNAQVKVSDLEQNVSALYPRGDGTLWVLSGRGLRKNPEGSLGIFDVFDQEGRFVRQVTLMGEGDPLQDGYFFVNDRLYVVTDFLDAAIAAQGGGTDETELDSDAEPMAIICYRLNTQEAGM